MAITQAQFDFLVQTSGETQAQAIADASGGVIPTTSSEPSVSTFDAAAGTGGLVFPTESTSGGPLASPLLGGGDDTLTAQEIIDLVKAGQISSSDGLQALLQIGVGDDDAKRLLEATGLVVFPQVQKTLTAPTDAASQVAIQGTALGNVVAGETGPRAVARGDLIRQQEETNPQAVFRRFLEKAFGFSNLGQPAQQALTRGNIENRTRNLFSQANILGLGGTPGQTAVPTGSFSDFLNRGAPPTSEALRLGLSNITSGLAAGGGNPFQTALSSAFNPSSAFTASLQPSLTDISPFLRRSFGAGAGQRFAQLQATSPELVQNPLDVFTRFQQQGFF